MRQMVCLLLLLAALPAAAQWSAPHGFADARYGVRTAGDPLQRDTSLAEFRLQLEFNYVGRAFEGTVRADARYDDLDADHGRVDLETGSGPLDLREAWLQFSPVNALDVKVGRQILTWGTGDLVFINDLFPKDWQSFFSGRDTDYLKAPSDAVMVSAFPAFGSVDLVYVPAFDADRRLTGERFSLFNPLAGGPTGRDMPVGADVPDRWFQDDELTVRVSGTRGGLEWALYGYDGYWKSPQGFDPAAGKAVYTALRVWGASLRGALGKGLFHTEVGLYDSRDDARGTDPLTPNSQWRYLVGYEREIGRDVTGSWQYYVEHRRDQGAYAASLPQGFPAGDRDRRVLTCRITARRMKDDLIWSLFVYASPTDEDGYARPAVTYKLNDAWQIGTGANVFWGTADHTFFGQFDKGDNVYASARVSF